MSSESGTDEALAAERCSKKEALRRCKVHEAALQLCYHEKGSIVFNRCSAEAQAFWNCYEGERGGKKRLKFGLGADRNPNL
mmetsp:Transcript_2910/g.3327  ORF Transcript_2910/g.3327 Transcript_2910/m.3327 type:complete len:81 (+) Transcript_2910:214-456(+)